METNIFILHTPFQLFTAQLAIEQYFLGTHRNILLQEGDIQPGSIRSELWNVVKPLNYVATVSGAARHAVERNVRIVEQVIGSANGKVNLLFSDIAWPTNNRLFFKHNVRGQVSFLILSDGLATYTCPGLSAKQRLRNIAKSLLGLIGYSASYTAYGGSMLGLEHPRVGAIYSFRADLLDGIYDCPLHDIAIESVNTERRLDVAMFLDQPYRGFMAADAWSSIRERTRAYLREGAFSKIYYKPHPMCDQDYYAELSGCGLTALESRLPAELLIRELDAGTIISYTSGALFNIKSVAGERVRAVALMPQLFLAVDGSGGKVKRSIPELFKAAGVEIQEE